MLSPSLATAARGFALGASLIIAIGAQNAFVLRQGLRRAYVLPVVATCTLCDWVLITIGAAGFGALVERFPALTTLTAWGGAAFLLFYGLLSFRSALKPGALDVDNEASSGPRQTLPAVVAFTLAVSLLNPHVYLDTVVLVGGIAAQYPAAERVFFAAGAMLASLVWFFGLGYGARLLAPVFTSPAAWRVLDVIIGVVMWSIAASLIVGQVSIS